jgi:3-deoxy-D-manno-octulosonic acid (KDO) 8-phosphate synthase
VDWQLDTQMLFRVGDRLYDAMCVTLLDGSSRTIYFDVTHFFHLPTKSPEELEAEGRHEALERLARVALEEGVEAAMCQWEEEQKHRG